MLQDILSTWAPALLVLMLVIYVLERSTAALKHVAKARALQRVAAGQGAAAAGVQEPQQAARSGGYFGVVLACTTVAAIGLALVFTPGLWQPREASRPLDVWLAVREDPFAEELFYQWWQLGTDPYEGRVPILDCAQWSPEHVVVLHARLLQPIPPLTREMLQDKERQDLEKARRDSAHDMRRKAGQRCMLRNVTLLPAAGGRDPGAHLLSKPTLADWLPGPGGASVATEGRGGGPEVVAVLRNGSRFYPVQGVRRVGGNASSNAWAYGPALLSEDGMLRAAARWVNQQMEHAGGGLRADALDRCLCPAYFGVFGSGLHLHYDLRAHVKDTAATGEHWALWPRASLARVLKEPAVCGKDGQVCAGNLSYAQFRATPWPSSLLTPLQAAGRAIDIVSPESMVIKFLQRAGVAKAVEPGWIDSELAPEDVSAVAAVFDLDGAQQEVTLSDPYDAFCFVHCAALEEAIIAV